MSEPTSPAPPSGSFDVGPEPENAGLPDWAPTEAGPVAEEDTLIGPPMPEPATVEAWSDETETADPDPQTWRKTWVIAAILALVGGGIGAGIWFGHFSWPQSEQHDSHPAPAPPTSSPTPTTNVATPPAPAPPNAPPPTTSLASSPTVETPPDVGMSPEMVAWYDRQFIANLRYNGWSVTNPVALNREAHKVCALLQKGATPADVENKMVAEVGITWNVAQQFTSTAMSTYPSCP